MKLKNHIKGLGIACIMGALMMGSTSVLAQAGDSPRPSRDEERRGGDRGGQDRDDDRRPGRTDPAPAGDTATGDAATTAEDAADEAADQAPSGAGAAGGAGGRGGAAAGQTGERGGKAAQKKLLLEEGKYRNQLARINRLRELAKAQGNEQRLAALDKLEAKMTELHERKMASARASMSDDEFEKVNKELQKGRGKSKGQSRRPDQARGGKPDDAGAKRNNDGAKDNKADDDEATADKSKEEPGARGGRPSNAGGRPDGERGGNLSDRPNRGNPRDNS